jgi:ferredoxin-NADP reductase
MKMTLKSKTPEVPGVYTFTFAPAEPVSWQPGQYMHYVLKHENPDDRGQERWFTISSAPYEEDIMITTRFDGEKKSSFKQALLKLEPGGTIEADGPKGSFTLQEGQHHHIFIAGGIGVTPFRSMLLQLLHDHQDKKIDLMYANRDSNFVYGDWLKDLQTKSPSFHLLDFVDKRIEEPDLAEFMKDKTAIYYLSGPRSMVEAYEHLLADKGVEKTAVMTDYFPGY